MSTKEATKSQGSATQVPRPQGICAVCAQPIAPEQKFMAALIETPAGFGRSDCCVACWEKLDRTYVIAFWQTAMPKASEKKKLFVDDEVLCELFVRLGDATEPSKLTFRFVLGLILMRKRLVIYESSGRKDDQEIWHVRLKGRDEILDLIDPKLQEDQMRQVSGQLSEILSQEM